MAESLNNYIDILKHKKQIILQGAPGTGKTYTSAAIAMRLIDGIDYESREDLMEAYRKRVAIGQIAFTTFHQSMDYEDFIEGFKPTTTEGDTEGKQELNYKVQEGIFKELCEKARIVDQSPITEEIIKEYFNIGDKVDQYTITDITYDQIKLDENYFAKYKYIKQHYNNKSFNEEDEYYGGFKYPITIAKYLYLCRLPHILIIDEINRGNISKILGELITLLEVDKRQHQENEISVMLPYSKQIFTVPPNLYIIGTMNTADRSIGYIDYAVRRRFAFITLKTERDNIELEKGKELFDKVAAIMTKENIAADLESEDLMIGHSYFMARDEQELKRKLNYEIKPLLLEYLKDGVLVGDGLKSKIDQLAC